MFVGDLGTVGSGGRFAWKAK